MDPHWRHMDLAERGRLLRDYRLAILLARNREELRILQEEARRFEEFFERMLANRGAPENED